MQYGLDGIKVGEQQELQMFISGVALVKGHRGTSSVLFPQRFPVIK